MDRREALKKLAVGGALAAGGSIVLSSNNVAFAQSADGPPPPAAFTVVVPTNGSGAGTIQLTAPPPPAGATGATYNWQILECSVSQGRTLVLINSSNNQIIARGKKATCSPIPVTTGPLPNVPAVVARTVSGGSSNPKVLEPGDTVRLRLVVRWTVASTTVEGRYNIAGTYPNIQVTVA
jgi:hypothetical protein